MTELRIGDGERDAAVSALGEHYAQGRLTKDELDERTDAAWTARTAADLRPLFADLPASAAARPGPPGPPASVAPPPRRRVPRQALLVALVVLVVVTQGKLLLLALLLWFVLSRHHAVPPPPWAHRGRGGPPHAVPPPPWGYPQGGHRR